jgi:hypothetical protein
MGIVRVAPVARVAGVSGSPSCDRFPWAMRKVTPLTPLTPLVHQRELTRDELEAEAGGRQRACLCCSWELAALGRCVCPLARDEDFGTELGKVGT